MLRSTAPYNIQILNLLEARSLDWYSKTERKVEIRPTTYQRPLESKQLVAWTHMYDALEKYIVSWVVRKRNDPWIKWKLT